MKKQLIWSILPILICLLNLVLSIIDERPLFFICLFSILLGFMIFATITIIMDVILKDHIYIEGEVIGIENKMLNITLKKNKLKNIELRIDNKTNMYQVGQKIIFIESRRSGLYIGLKELRIISSSSDMA